MKAVARVTRAALEPERLLAELAEPGFGAQGLFVGVVRDRNLGRAVESVEYEAHPALARKELLRVAEEAAARWGAAVGLVHREGLLKVGEASVVVAALAPHRREALEACAWAIDELKRRVPVWKKERYGDGSCAWLDGCALEAPRHTAVKPRP